MSNRFASKILVTAVCAFGSMASPLLATVLPVAYFQMGEHDTPGTLVDSSGNSNNVTVYNGPQTTTSSVAATSASSTGSTLATNFGGTDYGYLASSLTGSATTNFGVEGWFDPTSNSQQALVFNGDSGPGYVGYGLYIVGGDYEAFFGGNNLPTALAGALPVTANQWVYMALVVTGASGATDNGTVYFDNGSGLQTIPVSLGTLNAPTAAFSIGSTYYSSGGGGFAQ